jgi:uncharacterized membrane protein YdfJ with MMPL/SSD domain
MDVLPERGRTQASTPARPRAEPLLARTTRWILRRRRAVIAAWLAALLAGAVASTHLSPLLANGFAVPHTDSARAATILTRGFGDRSDGEYLVVFAADRPVGPAIRSEVQSAVERAARVVPSARAGPVEEGGRRLLYGTVATPLGLAQAKRYSTRLGHALRLPAGIRAYVSGQAAIQHDLDPVFSSDLHHGEFAIALPTALLVLLFVLGPSLIVTLPLLFAGATIASTLGLVFAVAHATVLATYVTNLVDLIGLALAVDYSLLVVSRFREELHGVGEVGEAIVRTMATAGRSVVFSGATVMVGLASLVFIPVPFVRSLGIGGLLIPIVSVAAATTLLPALLQVYGRRGSAPARLLRRQRRPDSPGFWPRLARMIMRRPLLFLAGGSLFLLLAAAPALSLRLTPGSADGIPQTLPSVHGFDLLRQALGAGALSPMQIVIDTGSPGGAGSRRERAATARLVGELRASREVVAVRALSDPTRRYEEIVAIGRHEYGQPPALDFVDRLRRTIVPDARFPAATRVLVGGGAAQGLDFLRRSYHAFPWLVLAVLALTYPLLVRAFRSLLLPLKAIVLNVLSVSASYGMLVVFFRWGLGARLFGLYHFPQIEGWIPIFLFALLFGLSMDYEVFLVTRMREARDAGLPNAAAVAEGLERTGRIVTAAAAIMVGAFAGFVAGRIAGLQEFGLGLAVAIFVDATVVRILLVPSLMAVFGRWNWWLPRSVARLLRVEASPLAPQTPPILLPSKTRRS